MSAAKKSAGGENPPPQAALPKKPESAKSVSQTLTGSPTGRSVNRISATVSPTSHNVHPSGHNPDEEIRILAHIYQPWADINENGSGIYALAHWAKYLEERGVSVVEGAVKDSTSFLRGLTHR